MFLGVDPDGAVAAKRPVSRIRFTAIVITALVVISAITAVGIVLVIALLCAPVLVHVDAASACGADAALRRNRGCCSVVAEWGDAPGPAGRSPSLGPLIGVCSVWGCCCSNVPDSHQAIPTSRQPSL